ncbi:hypothetical protein LCGC14_1805600 [marine sediment metagenome]|uniref:Uncharacterized protein n=1 Tax=marine sediment metagenome TaxID=412755 RepID=A0A0F9JN02_9ZZZZ
MILEILAVIIPSLLIGAGVMYLLLKSKKIERIVDKSEKRKYETMNDPEALLKKLNSNGIMVDDGDEISFVVEEKDGKKQLVQKIKKNTVAAGTPKVVPTGKPKTTRAKNPKKKGKVKK